MTLQFQPPPEWLLQEYMNRKSPAQVASEGANNILGTYVNMKNQENTQKLAQEDRDIKLADLSSRRGTNAMDTLNSIRASRGLPPLTVGATAPATPTQAAPPSAPSGPTPTDADGNPIAGPAQGPQLPGVAQGMAPKGPNGQPMPPTSGMGTPSPLIAHWNQTMGAAPGGPTPPGGKPQAPVVGDDPAIEEFNKIGSRAYEKKYGSDSLEEVKRTLDIQKGLQDKHKGPRQTVTPEQAIANGTFDDSKQMLVTPPANNQDAKDLRREDQMAKAVTDYGKQIETNPIIQHLQQQGLGLHNVEEMADLTSKGNTVASAAMGMKMARAMGEVGVITEQDVKRYVQSRKLTQAAADKLSGWINGVPSKATLDEIGQITETLKDSYQNSIQPIYNRYIDRFARAYKTTPEDAAYRLAFPYDKGTGVAAPQGASLPEIGGHFEGGRVLKITKVQKVSKP